MKVKSISWARAVVSMNSFDMLNLFVAGEVMGGFLPLYSVTVSLMGYVVSFVLLIVEE